jgi:acyl carrier protein phosphodiesterase
LNYLAHLHLAAKTDTSFSGNFLGDFVKGNPDGLFSEQIVEGIRLHRYVDGFTDKHPLVLEAKRRFPKLLRRYAPIALDMFWDHCLASNWPTYHTQSLSHFCLFAEQKIADEIKLESADLPERFLRINGWVWEDKWLESYQKMNNIRHALQRMSTRSERMSPLAETSQVLIDNYAELIQVFDLLYEDVLNASALFIHAYKKGD